MKFSLLLFGLCQFLKFSSLTNKAFKFAIKNAGVRMMFKTADNSQGRLLVFDKGRVTSRSGADHDFDVALVFKDAATGFSILSDRKSDAMFNAAARGDMHLEGMNAWAVWFEGITKLIL
ncbi:MAG: hypothetical protein KKA60_15800 [Proteobacteria bacterium]|nr:hypothetical protein [Pseudomonadota bacterium]